PAEIFKAYDIRGIVGQTLTAQHMQLIGQALGSEAVSRGIHQIVFGRDGRLSGPELGQALVKGLLSTGIDVIDVGMVPTPVLYYAAAELTEGSGVMLTGSHNPADYNGVKMVLNHESLSGDAIQALKQRIDNSDFVQGQGEYKTRPVSKEYIERIVSDVKLARPLKVVIDCGNGVAGAIAPKLYRALGCEVVELYSEVDGNFPNHHPDPSQPKNLQDLIEMVRSTGADVGLAFDGDGDRLGVVSPDGNIIWPDRLMMLYARDVLLRNPGAQIIYDIKCSNNLTTAIWAQGGEPVMWKTGHSLIKAKMQQTGALLAGEMSGHIFFKERWYGFDDALYAGARLLEILAADERPTREIFASLPDAENTPELRVDLPQEELDSFMNQLLAKVDFPDANIIMIDGVRADFEDGWGLVRASNTTPSLILRFEGRDKEALARIQDRFRTLLLEINPGLSLPF
ncbi:MAG TPA: phosphomannomutase/phosphoglucomutase, partial [Chromatiales bacterium]|nr:phosphomannomutase/phosphoglucomutase [Chromatiales bacterium]